MQSPGYMLLSTRQRLGFTQCQAGEGIATLSLYSKYETQEAYPTKERLPMLCQRLGIDADALPAAIDDYRALDRQYGSRLAEKTLRQSLDCVYRQWKGN